MAQEQVAESTQAETTDAKAGMGCLGIIVVVIFIAWLVLKTTGNNSDFTAVAKMQVIALNVEVLTDTDGAESVYDIIATYPASTREESVRQLVDFWFSAKKPRMYPTNGVDADWIERDPARRIVKRKMVRELLK